MAGRLYTFVLLFSLALAKPHSRRSNQNQCAAKGYDTDESYNAIYHQTLSSCAAACQKDSNCDSISWSTWGECNFYDESVSDNIEPDNSSPYSFYDIGCFASTTTTTTSTTKAPTTTAKLSTTTSTACAASTTPPCALPTWVIHNFKFVNSSSNLDCASNPTNSLCQSGKTNQPQGYGPPDSVSVIVDGIGSCNQQNPGTTPLRSIGNNVVSCGSSAQQVAFFGSSSSASSNATILLQNKVSCTNGHSYVAHGGAVIPMTCTYDAGKNATCTLKQASITVVPIIWDNVS